jgi:hypothetical protein
MNWIGGGRMNREEVEKIVKEAGYVICESRDFLDDYQEFTKCFNEIDNDSFIDYMDILGWYDGRIQEMWDYNWKTGDSWKRSSSFLVDILNFSKSHWNRCLDFMKEKGYSPNDSVTEMKKIYEMCSTIPWWDRNVNR